MVIFVDEQIPFLAESLASVGEVHTFNGRSLTRKHLSESNCEFLFVRSTTKVNQNLLDGTKVIFVGTATSGIDHIDTDYLKSKNIHFVEAKGSNANSVAEYVVFSILHWSKINQIDFKSQTIGIIGFGNIGKLVAKYSSLLGLKILINDPPLLEESYKKNINPFPNYVKYCELDDLLRNSTIVTNHTPLTMTDKYPTYRLLDEEKLQLIEPYSLFIHTSRGSVVVEKDLLDLQPEKKFSLVIDVWENEPNINTELVKECMICTPHVAGYSYDGKLRGTLKMLSEFEKFTNIKPNYSLIEKEISKYQPLSSEYFNNPDYIYEKLQQNRCLLEDTEQFKTIFSISNPTERAKFFDSLRKNYPKRRETL
ncbi:4-phosphoerythronate dehydrogenase [Bacteroidetes/Chlorobi group bacterium Naka2016]|jgi:erythronate-4-phosphate dehydrogenase|nr:MAG: 4-phosphoerythronate dehydrogenase [Bacteroidetes/Chlorobi group bacterium Naka2016]